MNSAYESISNISKKRQSRESDSDEINMENASKIQKVDANFWLYLKSKEQNLAKFALRQPKTFEKAFKEATKNAEIKLEDIQFFIAKGIMRIKCIDESQQNNLLAITKIGEIRVTATLPWGLKQTENVFKENRRGKTNEFKYVISGVATEIAEN